MPSQFDIFKRAGNGEPVWIEAVVSLEYAMRRVEALRKNFPGEYIIHSHSTGKDILFKANGGIQRSN